MNNSAKKIAMIGMFGGNYRSEYNPGCFMICLKTYQELKKRIENCEIDIFAVDNLTEEDKIIKEHKNGLDINFFPAKEGLSLLNSTFSKYDALVIGGDVVWMEYYEKNCGLFFINSESFLNTKKPVVLFNCVHRFNSVKTNEDLFLNIKKRSKYIAVRTNFLQNELNEIGINNIKVIPDPVLDLELKKINKIKNKKPLIGIAIRNKYIDPLVSLLNHSDLSKFDVCFYPYSRLYKNLDTIQKIRSIFGEKFLYILEYKDPVETFKMIARFDISVNDTYHGTIAAIIQNVPFVCINIEPPISSRITHLLEPFNLEKQIVSVYPEQGEKEPETLSRCIQEFNDLINDPPRVNHDQLKEVKKLIQKHFDSMADIIKDS